MSPHKNRKNQPLMLMHLVVTTMNPHNYPSEATNIRNTIIYVCINNVKLYDPPSKYGITYRYVQIYLKSLKISQYYRVKENLPRLIK